MRPVGALPNKNLLRLIPSVDEVLAVPEVGELRRRHPGFPWTRCVRELTEGFRSGDLGPLGSTRPEAKQAIVRALMAKVDTLRRGGLRRVINATGVILHTNLGRSLLGREVRSAVDLSLSHYTNLELDLDTGTRSRRGQVLLDLVRMATGAESAMIVNNNAAAVYLAVNSYSPPGRVLISRGEMVEIGGSFRLPDILRHAASQMIEVGTTNRTYIDDYAKEARAGDILMRAHRSNYDIQGFTHEASVDDLVGLARERGCYVLYDLGSGSLYDFTRIGLPGEERVEDVLASGVDGVTMSGDKLLGGVQAGVIVGSKKFVDGCAKNPLRRAVRIDKLAVAAMQALFRTYMFAGDPAQDIPTLRLAGSSLEFLKERAQSLFEALPRPARSRYRVEIVDDPAAMGGGSFAVQTIPSVALAFRFDAGGAASAFARDMRLRELPIIGRIQDNEVRLNLRSIPPEEDDDLKRELVALLRE
jgi:L-seryl-tRNA(Ser) seleniumtransferase